MAKAINFKPAPVDPSIEYERQLAAAPQEHAEAILTLLDMLQTAHDQGLLDLLHGAIGSRDVVAGKLAEYARQPEGIAGIRNLLALARLLGSIDPDLLDKLSRAVADASTAQKTESQPPSLLQLARRANSPDARRGLSYLTQILTQVGRALSR